MYSYHVCPLPAGLFQGLSLTARCTFGLLYDRTKLSNYNTVGGSTRWVDEDGVYCIYRVEELADNLGVSKRTVLKALEELRSAGLIWAKRKAFGSCNQHYIHPVAYAELRGSVGQLEAL